MTVAWILKEKGRHVVSALPGALLKEAVALLTKNRIGAVVIADELQRVLGILSERDIVHALDADGPAALDRPVNDYMTHSVTTCTEHHSIDWLMEEMTTRRFRHIPVAEHGRLAGIVSIGDVVKHKLALAESESAQMRQYFAAG